MFGIYWQEVKHSVTSVIFEGEKNWKLYLEKKKKKASAEGWVTAAAPVIMAYFLPALPHQEA